MSSASGAGEVRVDPSTGAVVHLVRGRQGRPNLPNDECPFCVGGIEAPEPYDVRWFPNRWPALGEGRCDVVLYTSDHDATLPSLGVVGVRRVVDLWAARTEALRAVDGIAFVLVFENRGAEVGATIAHPHGQIYAFDHVPARPLRRLQARWRPELDATERLVADAGGWRAVTQFAPVYPVSLSVFPTEQVGDLPSLSHPQRDGLAAMLVDVLDRLDRLYGAPLPYMMWVNQAPTPGHEPAGGDGGDGALGAGHWLDIEIVSPWRAPGVQRFIAAAEVACEEYFNTVVPEDVADRLRRLADR